MNMQLNLMEVNTNNLPNKHTQPTMMVIDNQIRIPYTIQNFPDGQNSIIIRELNYEEMCSDITIKSRLNSFLDLELILCATAALKNEKVNKISLFIPYFLGARSDRKFQKGGINYLKDVIAPIINSQNYTSITVYDPHSDVLEAVLNNFNKINNFDLVNRSIEFINNTSKLNGDCVIVSPDAGSLKKIYDVSKHLNIYDIITCSKNREIKTGNILNTTVSNLDKYTHNNKFIIIDDICDGGRTFIEISKAIREKITNAEIYLIVSHGIFSNGLKELNNHFNKIFVSNSYMQIDSMSEFGIRNEKYLNLIKQFNLF